MDVKVVCFIDKMCEEFGILVKVKIIFENYVLIVVGFVLLVFVFVVFVFVGFSVVGRKDIKEYIFRLVCFGFGFVFCFVFGDFVIWEKGEFVDGSDLFVVFFINKLCDKMFFVVVVVLDKEKKVFSWDGMCLIVEILLFFEKWVFVVEIDLEEMK